MQCVADTCVNRCVPLPKNLHVQADNTCNESETPQAWLPWGTLSGKSFLRRRLTHTLQKGRTHFKLDHQFSTRGSRLVRDVSYTTVEGPRDWDDFLQPLNVQLHGRTGPAAPRQFMLVRREHLVEDGATDLNVERRMRGLDLEDHPKGHHHARESPHA